MSIELSYVMGGRGFPFGRSKGLRADRLVPEGRDKCGRLGPSRTPRAKARKEYQAKFSHVSIVEDRHDDGSVKRRTRVRHWIAPRPSFRQFFEAEQRLK